MRRIHDRLVMLMTLSFLALVVAQLAQGEGAGALVVGLGAATISAIAVSALLAARYSGALLRSRSLTVGARARQHRESLTSMPEPQHPNTVGRVRSRAPGRIAPAA